MTPRFTLTLGLRYEYTSPEKDKRGFSFSIIPGAQSQRFVNAPTDLVFPGDPRAPSGWYFPDSRILLRDSALPGTPSGTERQACAVGSECSTTP